MFLKYSNAIVAVDRISYFLEFEEKEEIFTGAKFG